MQMALRGSRHVAFLFSWAYLGPFHPSSKSWMSSANSLASLTPTFSLLPMSDLQCRHIRRPTDLLKERRRECFHDSKPQNFRGTRYGSCTNANAENRHAWFALGACTSISDERSPQGKAQCHFLGLADFIAFVWTHDVVSHIALIIHNTCFPALLYEWKPSMFAVASSAKRNFYRHNNLRCSTL